MPDLEVMKYRIEAQRVVLALFKSVQNSQQALRNPKMSDAKLAKKLMRNFEEFEEKRESVLTIPTEFQLIPFETLGAVTNLEDMLALGGILGKYVTPQRVHGVFPKHVLVAA